MVWDKTVIACLCAMPEGKVSQMAEEKESNAVERRRTGSIKYRDSSSKIIFEDPVLCAQFLRGYTDIPALKNVQPEDIEDVTERYVHLFNVCLKH